MGLSSGACFWDHFAPASGQRRAVRRSLSSPRCRDGGSERFKEALARHSFDTDLSTAAGGRAGGSGVLQWEAHMRAVEAGASFEAEFAPLTGGPSLLMSFRWDPAPRTRSGTRILHASLA